MRTDESPVSFQNRKAAPVYRLYGIGLRSQVPVACRATSPRWGADAELVTTSLPLHIPSVDPDLRTSSADDWFHCARTDDGSLYLRWTRLSEFLISPDGRRISCHPFAGTSPETLGAYLVPQALSCALVQQGIEPLHATVAVVNGKAIAFLGDCGSGKSSLGAAFLNAGHRLLTDDLLVIGFPVSRAGQPLAHPGLARIKLFPTIATRLLGASRAGVPMNPQTHKLIIPLTDGEYCGAAVPLKAIYVLRPPAGRSMGRIALRTLPLRRACIELIANTFNLIIIDRARLARQLHWAARVASAVPLKSLSYPRHLAQIGRVVAAIASDASR